MPLVDAVAHQIAAVAHQIVSAKGRRLYVSVAWIPAYSGVLGNQVAESIAGSASRLPFIVWCGISREDIMSLRASRYSIKGVSLSVLPVVDEIYPLHTYQFGAAKRIQRLPLSVTSLLRVMPKMYEDERFELVISRRPRLDRLFVV